MAAAGSIPGRAVRRGCPDGDPDRARVLARRGALSPERNTETVTASGLPVATEFSGSEPLPSGGGVVQTLPRAQGLERAPGKPPLRRRARILRRNPSWPPAGETFVNTL